MSKPEKISSSFRIRKRFMRSVRLDRDFEDTDALEGYIVTKPILQSFNRISGGLKPKSSQRAWRITGDYGSGKSSFALLLAQSFSGESSDIQKHLPPHLLPEEAQKNKLIPILVTGSREPLVKILAKQIFAGVTHAGYNKRTIKALGSIESFGLDQDSLILDDFAEIVATISRQVAAKGKHNGLLIILDELGKFLEFAAQNPDKQDVYLLQQLAEISSRSGETPIFVIGLLHQGIHAYADKLSQSSLREWEKVAGRFEEIVFDQPLDQVSHLVSSALNLKKVPHGWKSRAQDAVSKAVSGGLFGSAVPITSIKEAAVGLYPLHPSLIPLLVKFFVRFGQNERSLFSFLLSSEPFGLMEFSEHEENLDHVFTTANFYDYVSANFGYRLSSQSYRSHWNHIEAIVNSVEDDGSYKIKVLKTVALFNLLNSPELIATEETLVNVLTLGDESQIDQVKEAIKQLSGPRPLLYRRGSKGGFRLWAHSSVNLELAYEEAVNAVPQSRKVTDVIHGLLDARPLVARRHYITTGNLRCFDLVYASVDRLKKAAHYDNEKYEGIVVIPLCETIEDVQEATGFAKNHVNEVEVVFGIPKPLVALADLVVEVDRWMWIEQNTPELKDDRYAAEEVTRQIAEAKSALEQRVNYFVGFDRQSYDTSSSILWISRHEVLSLGSSKDLLEYLSCVCDEIYPKAPLLHNELLNRNKLSSAAAAARMGLIEGVFQNKGKKFFGMDPTKAPPEMSMYRSFFENGYLHRPGEDSYFLKFPAPQKDPLNLHHSLDAIVEILEKKPDSRVSIKHIQEVLRDMPYGVKDGVFPLLILLVLQVQGSEIAVYESGTFIPNIDSYLFQRLIKVPESFELQLYRITGLRKSVFKELGRALEIRSEGGKEKIELLDIVRPICEFVAGLPEYTLKTDSLSGSAKAVRDAILNAREPSKLLFEDLPLGCGFEAFSESSKFTSGTGKQFVKALIEALEEMRQSLPALQSRMTQAIMEAFGRSVEGTLDNIRASLSDRAQTIVVSISDPELKPFCLKFIDDQTDEAVWLESLGSFLTKVPPSRWRDSDEKRFVTELKIHTSRFLRMEALLFAEAIADRKASAFRVSITSRTGEEKETVVFRDEEDPEIAKSVNKELDAYFNRNSGQTLLAISEYLWKKLKGTDAV